MLRITSVGALAFAGAFVLSSCSGSSVQQSGTLPAVQRQSAVRPAAAPNVKITEYPVIRHPQQITIGPDGAVWFASATPESSATILYVYRFAANDGQGRYYTLPSVLFNQYPQFVTWGQQGPLITFAGRMWIAFQSHGPSDEEHSGLVQMTAHGVSVNANVTHFQEDIGAAAVQGNRLWLLPTEHGAGSSPPFLASFVLQNGALRVESQVPPPCPEFNPCDGEAVRLGADGNLYALSRAFLSTEFTGVSKVSPSGRVLAMYQLRRFEPVDMAFGPDGALWITSAPYIIRMTTNGTRSLYTIPYSGTSPTAITAGHDGAMWFVDPGTSAIGRITMSGAVSEYPVPSADAFSDYSPTSIVACPVAVAACGSGDIWFPEQNTSKLGRVHF